MSGPASRLSGIGFLVGIAAGTAALAGLAPGVSASGNHAPTGRVLFVDGFGHANGTNNLVTNEYASFNPADQLAVRSATWQATSGSLFAVSGAGWTGAPDGCKPDRFSQTCNDSAVFRLHTRRFDFGDVRVSFDLVNDSLTTTTRTPAQDYDGVHIWLRYQSETELYAVSVNRRDGSIVIKKKCPGGTSNGGTYYTLAASAGKPIPFGSRQRVAATAKNGSGGSVTITLSRDGSQLLRATDQGTGCAALTSPGAVGIRGDNDDFHIDNFTVRSLSSKR